MPASQYPGRLIKKGDPDAATVRRIQRRLNARGCGPIGVDGGFDTETERAVKLFQARFPDADGQPLLVDGKVGSITWAALFGEDSVSVADTAPTRLLAKAITIARSQIGVLEQPPGSNRGPEVDEYIRRVGLRPADRFAWCAANHSWHRHGERGPRRAGDDAGRMRRRSRTGVAQRPGTKRVGARAGDDHCGAVGNSHGVFGGTAGLNA